MANADKVALYVPVHNKSWFLKMKLAGSALQALTTPNFGLSMIRAIVTWLDKLQTWPSAAGAAPYRKMTHIA